MNRLYFGDNLSRLRNRDEVANESVDLAYLHPRRSPALKEGEGEAPRAQ